MDTTTRRCKICEQEFDSIYDIDNGVCDECGEMTNQTIINALIEKFDDLQELTGQDFTHTKRIILRWAKDNKIFK